MNDQYISTCNPFSRVYLSANPPKENWWNSKFHFGYENTVCIHQNNQVIAYDFDTKMIKYTINDVQNVLAIGEVALVFSNEGLKSSFDICSGQQCGEFTNQFFLTCKDVSKNLGFSYSPDAIKYIFSFLDPFSLCQASQVCTLWKGFEATGNFWAKFSTDTTKQGYLDYKWCRKNLINGKLFTKEIFLQHIGEPYNTRHFPFHFWIDRSHLYIHNYNSGITQKVQNVLKPHHLNTEIIFNHKLSNFVILNLGNKGFTVVDIKNKSINRYHYIFHSIMNDQYISTCNPFSRVYLSANPPKENWWNSKFHFGYENTVCIHQNNQVIAYDFDTKMIKYTINDVQNVLAIGEVALVFSNEGLKSSFDICSGQQCGEFTNQFFLTCKDVSKNLGFSYSPSSKTLFLRDFKKK